MPGYGWKGGDVEREAALHRGKDLRGDQAHSTSPGTCSFTVVQALNLRCFASEALGNKYGISHCMLPQMTFVPCVPWKSTLPLYLVGQLKCMWVLLAFSLSWLASLSSWIGVCVQPGYLIHAQICFFDALWVGLWVCLRMHFLFHIPSAQCRAQEWMFKWTDKLRQHNDYWLSLSFASV